MQNLLKYFGFIMVIIYLGIGMFLILVGDGMFSLNRTIRLVLGTALILYGLFRAWRTFKIHKNE